MRLLRALIQHLGRLFWIVLRRWYNLCIRGIAMDADEAKEITAYFLKVAADPSYQPQNAKEKSFEQRLIDTHNLVLKEHPEFDSEYILNAFDVSVSVILCTENARAA